MFLFVSQKVPGEWLNPCLHSHRKVTLEYGYLPLTNLHIHLCYLWLSHRYVALSHLGQSDPTVILHPAVKATVVQFLCFHKWSSSLCSSPLMSILCLETLSFSSICYEWCISLFELCSGNANCFSLSILRKVRHKAEISWCWTLVIFHYKSSELNTILYQSSVLSFPLPLLF